MTAIDNENDEPRRKLIKFYMTSADPRYLGVSHDWVRRRFAALPESDTVMYGERGHRSKTALEWLGLDWIRRYWRKPSQ